MKKLLCLIAFVFFAAIAAHTQMEKGGVLIGTSTSVWGGVNSYGDLFGGPPNHGGISFIKSKTKYDGQTEDGTDLISMNLSPRIGYNFIDGFVAGIKADLTSTTMEDLTVSSIGAGPFVRYYIPMTGKVKPFVEGEFSLNRVKVSGNKSKLNSTHWSGGTGLAFCLGESETFDVMAGYFQNTTKNPDSESDSKDIVSGFGLGFGFSMFLK